MNPSLEHAEEWLSRQAPRLQSSLGKSISALLGILGPILLVWLPPSPKWKIVLPALYILILLCLLLLTLWCGSRTKVRQLQAELAKEPELPALDGFDNSVLIHLVVNHLGRYADRISSEMGLETYKILRSLDKLEAHNFIAKKLNTHSGLYEYTASPQGRARLDTSKPS
jgi:hypothetical protein